jgi:alanine racemase
VNLQNLVITAVTTVFKKIKIVQATLTIDLVAIKNNLNFVRDRTHPALCAGVVKANAYGLGIDKIAPYLLENNVHHFFVATLEEGAELRDLVGKETIIFVLNGVFKNEKQDFIQHRLIPCLNNTEQLNLWHDQDQIVLHIDTGLNRLGFNPDALPDVKNVALVMSHLACADKPEHEMNAKQRDLFIECAKHYPNAQRSLAASDGIFCGTRYHFEMVRPGAALYGLNPRPNLDNPMNQVIRLQAPIIQLRTIQKSGSVGYGATAQTHAGQMLATVALGYADGLLRSVSNKANLYFGDHILPIMGRVSMDLITVDVSNLPDDLLHVGMMLDVFSPYQTPEQLANVANTIDYELFTALGHRFKRIYMS